MSSSVAVVIPSCDKYSDLWEAFFATLQLRWSDCPYPLFLVTNEINFKRENVSVIRIGEDRTWSANLAAALLLIPHDYVLLIMDDLFLKSRINEERVASLIDKCVSQEWDYLRLNPTPGPSRPGNANDGVGPIVKGDWYRSSTVMSLWRKEVLLDVLNPKENAWEFEIFGSDRTDKYQRWFASVDWNLPFHNVVIKGKLDPFALWELRSENIDIATHREVMGILDASILVLKRFRSKLMLLVPRAARRKIRSKFAPN